MKMHTYLNFGDNYAQAFRFYEQHLGGKIVSMMTFGDMPEPRNVPAGLGNDCVLHARMIIGDALLMASDAPPQRFQPMRSSISHLLSTVPKKQSASMHCSPMEERSL
jgi:PhnB protein